MNYWGPNKTSKVTNFNGTTLACINDQNTNSAMNCQYTNGSNTQLVTISSPFSNNFFTTTDFALNVNFVRNPYSTQ
jgi:dTDP-4-dehydrorhamnose 3,5-epimerase-like enzyme